MKAFLIKNAVNLLNTLELIALIIVFFATFSFQFIWLELPCPLCLLQRIGTLAICIGFLLNLRFGLRPSHYGLILLSALFTALVALRQIALHVVPGTGSYGPAIFGLHMYTWSFIIAMLVIIGTVILLSFDRQYFPSFRQSIYWKYLVNIFFSIIIIICLINVISTYKECGLQQCPENPTHYLY